MGAFDDHAEVLVIHDTVTCLSVLVKISEDGKVGVLV